MSATLKKWEKAILGSVWTVLVAWSGWALSNTFVRNACNQRINELGARVDVVQGEQERRRGGVESIPVIAQKMDTVEQLARENRADIKRMADDISWIKGAIAKQVAAARAGEE